MNVLSLFSGAGGMDIGLEAAGHTIVGMCEIDPKCREVLAYRWPDVELHEDVTTLDGSLFRGRVDVVSGGSPCQDLSVAGRRQGLDGARSGLFWHQCRIADQSAARWVLWENVAGALSSNLGTDFAAVLWGLTGTCPRVPDGGWKSCGVVVGPKRWAVWRLFDARWFGVPQRRRRVFVVAGAGGEPRPEILFEFDSSPRNPAPSRTPPEEVARTLGGGTPGSGPRTNLDQMMFIQMAFSTGNNPNGELDAIETAPTLDTRSWQGSRRNQAAVAIVTSFRGGNINGWRDGVGPLRAMGGDLGGGSETLVVSNSTAVRRLTPLECERLMGWPDSWTAEGINGPIADLHRYRMCGNGVVSNVAEWIGRRL